MSEHDPHLLAALRHAPDRDAAPPPEVTARILAAARDAVRPAVSASLWQRLATWLVQPQVSAAFATLALATVLGVMWSTHEPPEPASTPVAPPPAADVAAAPAVVMPAVPPAPPPTLPAPAAERRAAAKAERQRVEARESAAKAVADAPPAPTPAPTEALAKADAAAPASPAPAAAPPPAVAPAPVAEPAHRARDERVAATNEVGALAGSRAAAPAALSLAPRSSPPDPLPSLAAPGTPPWTWHGSALRGERAHGEPQQALWAALRVATQGRWQASSAPPAALPAPWLVLQQGGQQWTFRLADDALFLVDPQGRAWRAPVSAEQARDWQRAVSSW